MREKVRDAARELGLDVTVRTLDESTKTVREAAAAVGCQEAMIAKSIVMVCDGDPVVCVTSGAHRVDVERVALALDCAEVRTATPDEVRAATGFPIGGVPPFGYPAPLRTFVDEDLVAHEVVWAACGMPHVNFRATPADLVRATGAAVCDLAAAG